MHIFEESFLDQIKYLLDDYLHVNVNFTKESVVVLNELYLFHWETD